MRIQGAFYLAAKRLFHWLRAHWWVVLFFVIWELAKDRTAAWVNARIDEQAGAAMNAISEAADYLASTPVSATILFAVVVVLALFVHSYFIEFRKLRTAPSISGQDHPVMQSERSKHTLPNTEEKRIQGDVNIMEGERISSGLQPLKDLFEEGTGLRYDEDSRYGKTFEEWGKETESWEKKVCVILQTKFSEEEFSFSTLGQIVPGLVVPENDVDYYNNRQTMMAAQLIELRKIIIRQHEKISLLESRHARQEQKQSNQS